MFKELFYSWPALWVYVPAVLVGLWLFFDCRSYRRQFPPGGTKQRSYPLATLRKPIEAAVSVAGIVIPLLGALIAYLAGDGTPIIPLAAALLFLVAATILGLWNLFSMTASKDERITITDTSLTYFIPSISLQFIMAATGIFLVLLFFLFSFRLPHKSPPALSPASVLIARPHLRAGNTEAQVTNTWGPPSQTDKGTNAATWRYESASSQFTIVISNGLILSITETSK